MERKTSRNLYLIGLLLVIIASVLLAVGGIGAVGGILAIVAWIGALVKTARLSQWLWFILLIVFSGITMLVYIFAGPTKPAESGQMS